MRLHLVSLAAGCLVGVIYSIMGVRSPAPPIVALVGLLGMLIGEQIPPLITSLLRDKPATHSWLNDQVLPHVFGHLPAARAPESRVTAQLSDASKLHGTDVKE